MRRRVHRGYRKCSVWPASSRAMTGEMRMKTYGGQRNHIKKKHKRHLKQLRWNASQLIKNGSPKRAES